MDKLFADLHKTLRKNYKTLLGYPCNLTSKNSNLHTFLKYYLNNAGDPDDSSNFRLESKPVEKYVIKYFAKLFSRNPSTVWGYVTSGGTEGNLYGIYMARETYPDGILYFSNDSHYSIQKIAKLLNIPAQAVNSQDNGEIDYSHLEQLISENSDKPVIINVNYGTTMKGAIDNTEQILAILRKLKISKFYLHADAALFGMLLVHIKDAPKLEIVPLCSGINSMSFSGHKFIGSTFPCGIVLIQKDIIDFTKKHIEYINAKDTTILGSRNGHSPIVLAYAIKDRGASKFKIEAEKCLANAKYLKNALEDLNFNPSLNNFSNTVYFDSPKVSIIKKWQLATQGNIAHIVVMQHVDKTLINKFVSDLRVSISFSKN